MKHGSALPGMESVRQVFESQPLNWESITLTTHL